MDYPEDIVDEARVASWLAIGQRNEDVLFRVVANMLMRERKRCAQIAKDKFPQGQYGSNYARAGSMIADEILGNTP